MIAKNAGISFPVRDSDDETIAMMSPSDHKMLIIINNDRNPILYQLLPYS
jgi:hypothetical protein